MDNGNAANPAGGVILQLEGDTEPRQVSLAEFDAAYADLRTEGVRLCLKPARGIYASGFRVLMERPDLDSFLKGELYQMSVAAARRLASAPSEGLLAA